MDSNYVPSCNTALNIVWRTEFFLNFRALSNAGRHMPRFGVCKKLTCDRRKTRLKSKWTKVSNGTVTSVVTVRLDNKFWPSWSLQRIGDQWVREELIDYISEDID